MDFEAASSLQRWRNSEKKEPKVVEEAQDVISHNAPIEAP